MLHFNYNRWNRVHSNYQPYEEVEEVNYASFRKQLPPDGHNFVFVPLLDIPNLVYTNYALPPTEMCRKIEDNEFKNIVKSIVEKIKAAPSAPICGPWCCVPCCGPCIHAQKMEQISFDNRLDAGAEACTQINKELLSARGITSTYIYQDKCFTGIVLEVNPLMSNGTPNPYWTGNQPNLKPAEQQAVIQFQQMEQGVQLDDAAFEQMFENAAADFDANNEHFDKIDAVAHGVAVLEILSAKNQVCAPALMNTKQYLEALSATYAIDSYASLLRARQDIVTFKTNFSFEWSQFIATVSSPTFGNNNPEAYIRTVVSNFVDSCALPEIYPFDKALIDQFVATQGGKSMQTSEQTMYNVSAPAQSTIQAGSGSVQPMISNGSAPVQPMMQAGSGSAQPNV
jgi:hypothetical protein